MYCKCAVVFMFLSCAAAARAVPVYTEGFDSAGLDGKGAVGDSSSGVSVEMAGVTTFSIDVSGAGLDDDSTPNWFQVRNGRFEGQDVGGAGATFLTSVVDVSGYSLASISIDVGVLGDGASVASESISLAYSLNPSSLTPTFVDFFSASEGNPGLPSTVGESLINVSGTGEFQVRVIMDANGADDGWYLDDIRVIAVPEPSAFLYGGFVATLCGIVVKCRRSRLLATAR